MPTDLQNSSNVQRTISLLAIVTVTFGIGLAAYDAGRRPTPTGANANPTPVASAPAQAAGAPTAPRFERSDEPAIETDSLNAHGG